MAVTGTKVPVKNAKFECGTGNDFPCDDVTLTGSIDLEDVSDNASGGAVERTACFKDGQVEFSAPWRALGVGMTMGDSFNFIATIVPTTVVVTLPMLVESIKLIGRLKGVWRVQVVGKTSGTFTFALPPAPP